ncbi:MAG: hypothetical protein N4A61_10220 [Pelagimonas sp.]|nr:hypothetical protein [Pelagimonas sp.]
MERKDGGVQVAHKKKPLYLWIKDKKPGDMTGYLTVFWQDGPWRYSLVGDQKREPTGQIARLIHGQMI